MDNVEINPTDFYYGIHDIKTSIDEVKEVRHILTSLESLEYDVSLYLNSIDNILVKLNELYSRLLNVKEALILAEPGIGYIFNTLDSSGDDFGDYLRRDYNQGNDLDDLKGNNKDIGGLLSKNAKSIINNPDNLLNRIKGNNKGLGGKLTTDATSILLGGN